MKHVRESLNSFMDYKFFSKLNEEFEEEKDENEDEKEEEKEDEPKVENKNDKKEQGELRDKEKDGLATIEKLKSNFEEFKKDADGDIVKYKEFWEENKAAKEKFGEGDIYKMYDSDYVIGVLELPAETLSDGSIDGGLGATDEPEEEIIEGKEIGAPTGAPETGGNDLSEENEMVTATNEDEAAKEDFDIDLDAPAGEEDDINLDLENPEGDMGGDMNIDIENPAPADGGQADQMDLDTDTQGAPAEVPGDIPPPTDTAPAPDIPVDMPVDTGMPADTGSQPNLTGPQVYFVVYDDSGDEREEILRTGSNNVVNAFKEFYNDTFKGSMKSIIQKYKEAKEAQKIEAEKAEKKSVEKEKSSKIGKFLGEK